MAGLTVDGFENKDFDTILSELEADLKAAFGEEFDVSASSPMGPINAIYAAKLSELWELLQDVYSTSSPNGAYGAALDQLGQLTGITRDDETRSSTLCSVSGTPGVIITTDAQIKHSETASLWYPTTQITIGAASAATAYFNSVDFGPVTALAGKLTIIETPVVGWTAVTNLEDADLGNEVESDASFRVRRKRDLARAGSGTVRAIVADVGALDDIESVVTFENVDDEEDDEGMPGHSFEVLVEGGDETEIAQAIYDNRPAGISAYGTTGAYALDAAGASAWVAFSRPVDVNIYVAVTAVTATGFGATGDVAGGITGYGDSLAAGDDVAYTRLYGPAYVDGVDNVTDLRISTAASPTATDDIPISRRQRSKWDSTRITVWTGA